MAQLILIDHTTQREVGRRAMVSEERYQLYRDHRDEGGLLFYGVWYVTHTVSWRSAEEQFVATVTNPAP